LLKQSKFVKEALRQGMTEKKEELNLEVAPIPFVYVSSKKSDQGIIVNLNSLFTTFFGYQKEELVGKKMTVLLPKIYTGVHEKYIKSFIENILMNLRVEAEIESDYLDVEKVNYFKHKNGYIFPLSYKVVLNLDVLMFIATFKGEATIKSFVYFIVDRNWEIQEMSTGAITYFDLEIKTVLSKPCRLDILIPEVVGQGKGDIMYSVKGVDGGEEVFYFKKEVTEIQFPKRSKAEDSDDEDNKGPENSGYKLIKLERIDRSEANIRSQSMMLMKKGKTSSGSLAPDSQSSHQNIPKITVG
jgi:PAS domain S-box-containing protein